MRRFELAFIILLLVVSYNYANGLSAEEAERQAKERQLEQVAARFKAEAGFRGDITPNGALSHLGILRGNFTDVPFSAGADTTSFRQACNRIIDKILPYTLATRNQLSMSRISSNLGRTETEYYQTVNGYRVENSGLILIAYDTGRFRFSISNGTVELPEGNASSIITSDEAKQIALQAKNDEHYTSAKCLHTFYTNEGSDHYYLAYLVEVSSSDAALYEDVLFWIDANTGLVKLSMLSPSIE
jgi:hypothetical protein